jgi:preprotein translocase subunit SecA
MDQLREGIGLRGYAQTNPLQAYAMEGFQIFETMQDNIDEQISNFLLNMHITQNTEPQKQKPIITNDGKEHLKSKPKKNDSKIGRNDPCPCGSGKKYKQCCGK